MNTQQNNRHLSDPNNWVKLYGNYLYRFALGRLRNTTDAENAVQETFLAALKARERFSGKSSERTWLIGILKHKIIDYFRKKYRETPVTDLQLQQEDVTVDSFFDHVGHPHKYPSDWEADPSRLTENKEFWVVLEDCIKKLPQATASAFTFREMEKMDSQEICQILNITTTNLWVMLHRARLQLRGCLEENWFEKNAYDK